MEHNGACIDGDWLVLRSRPSMATPVGDGQAETGSPLTSTLWRKSKSVCMNQLSALLGDLMVPEGEYANQVAETVPGSMPEEFKAVSAKQEVMTDGWVVVSTDRLSHHQPYSSSLIVGGLSADQPREGAMKEEEADDEASIALLDSRADCATPACSSTSRTSCAESRKAAVASALLPWRRCPPSDSQAQEDHGWLVLSTECPSKPSAAEFVLVARTFSTSRRELALRGEQYLHTHPGFACIALWCWFVFLLAGESSTTIWWLHLLGMRGVLLLVVSATALVLLGLATLNLEQVAAAMLAFLVALMPTSSAYTAVVLILPSEDVSSPRHYWSMLQWPTLVAFGILYLAAALLPALQADNPKPSGSIAMTISVLEGAKAMALRACWLLAWIYAAVVAHLCLVHACRRHDNFKACTALAPPSASLSRFFGDCALLILHAVTLMCGWARCQTLSALGDQLLPRLLGARRAEALAPRALLMRKWRTFIRRLPELRRATPPRAVIALVVTVRRLAPALFPALALMTRMGHWPIAIMSLGLLLAFIGTAVYEWRTLPQSPILGIPHLLPAGVSPRVRKLLGAALAVAEGVEGLRSWLVVLGNPRAMLLW